MFTKAESITMCLGGIQDEQSAKKAVQLLKQQKGVKSAAVNWRTSTADVTFLPDKITVDTLTYQLESAGFPVV